MDIANIRKLKVFYFNANGWHNKRLIYNNIILKEDPDVIVIADTGLKEDQKLKIYNYLSKKSHWR